VDPRPSIAGLRASGMRLHWFEAVALVQTLCQTVVDQAGSGDLDLATAFLTPDGAIDLAKPPDPGKAFPHIRKLLNDLVPPYEFAVSKVLPDSSIAEFLNALKYYERPNRDEIVQSIATRFSSQMASNTLVPPRPVEPQRPEPTAEEAEAAAQAAADAPVRRARILRLVAVAGFLGCVGTAGVWALNNPAVETRFNAYAASLTSLAVGGNVPGYGNAPATSKPETETDRGDRPTTHDRAAKPAEASAAPRSVARTETPAARAVSAPAAASAPKPAAVVPSTPAPPPPLATGPSRGPAFAAPPQPATAPASTPAVVPVDPVDPAESAPVFDAAQRDVTPPEFVYPNGPPSVPEGVDPATAPALEVMVNERGTVEGAKLSHPPRSLAESMQMMSEISAAKMWRFKPAMRAGRPVRYRLVVKLGPR
jgi:hypothetical protein